MGYLKHQEIAAMEPKPHEWARRWIPVEEALPEDREWCWVYTGSEPFPAIYDARSTNTWTNGDTWEDFDHAVTHWMPLPAPPEVQ
jgi:hypothetical protein